MSNFNVTKWNRLRYLAEAESPENWDDANLAAQAIDRALEADSRISSLLPAELAKAFIIVARSGYQDDLYKDFQMEMANQLRSVLEEIKAKSAMVPSTETVANILKNSIEGKEYDIRISDRGNYVEINGSDKELLDSPKFEELTGYKIFSDIEDDRGYIVRFYPPK